MSHVAIVGAGPGGATLAYLLARNHIDVTLLERHDDFEREFRKRPADHVFRSLENTVITPHLGYVEQDNYRSYFEGYRVAIRGFLDGAPVNVING